MKEIRLRALQMGDLASINYWHNDEEINALTCGQRRFVSVVLDEQWLRNKLLNNDDQVYCGIWLPEQGFSDALIGYTSLNNIDLVNRQAEWGGIVLDQSKRGQNYGTQAAMQILKYGFHELGLEKISGRWLVENVTSIAFAHLLGFQKEGVLRREVFKSNHWHDVLMMSVLKEEFEIKFKIYYGQK